MRKWLLWYLLWWFLWFGVPSVRAQSKYIPDLQGAENISCNAEPVGAMYRGQGIVTYTKASGKSTFKVNLRNRPTLAASSKDCQLWAEMVAAEKRKEK
jgi:hypothetical protein